MMGWQKPFRGTQLKRPHPLARGLVGAWLINEETGDIVPDLSGNGRHGVFDCDPTRVPSGIHFESGEVLWSQPVVRCGDAGWFPSNKGTVIVQVCPHTTGPNQLAMWWTVDRGTSVSLPSIGMGRQISVSRALFMYNAGFSIFTSGWNIDVDKRQVVATTFDSGNKAEIFVDGKLFHGNYSLGELTQGTGNFSFGGYSRSLTNSGLCDIAEIYSVYVYDRVLSAEEIALVSREPYCMFTRALDIGAMLYAVPVVGGSIINQFQKANLGADLFNGSLI